MTTFLWIVAWYCAGLPDIGAIIGLQLAIVWLLTDGVEKWWFIHLASAVGLVACLVYAGLAAIIWVFSRLGAKAGDR